MKYHKLVRDKIPEIIQQSGVRPVTRIVKGPEFVEMLLLKLVEEVEEFKASREIEELADILEVIKAFCSLDDLTLEDLERIRHDKAEKRGGFANGIILEETME